MNSIGSRFAERAVDYVIENPHQAIAMGKAALGALGAEGELVPQESPARPYMVGFVAGAVIGFVLAAWMCSSGPSKRNKEDELLRPERHPAQVHRDGPAPLRPQRPRVAGHGGRAFALRPAGPPDGQPGRQGDQGRPGHRARPGGFHRVAPVGRDLPEPEPFVAVHLGARWRTDEAVGAGGLLRRHHAQGRRLRHHGHGGHRGGVGLQVPDVEHLGHLERSVRLRRLPAPDAGVDRPGLGEVQAGAGHSGGGRDQPGRAAREERPAGDAAARLGRGGHVRPGEAPAGPGTRIRGLPRRQGRRIRAERRPRLFRSKSSKHHPCQFDPPPASPSP